MKTKRIIVLLALILLAVLCTTCGDLVLPGKETESRPLPIENNGKAKVLAVTNMSSLNAQLEFLISSTPLSPDESASSRSALSRQISGHSTSGTGIRMDLDHVSEFNANPPPFSRDKPDGKLRSLVPVFYTVGQTKDFWLETGNSNEPYDEVSFTLQAQGIHCDIWVAADNFDNSNNSINIMDNKVTKSRVTEMALKFDTIYPLATKLLGYEYGGGFEYPYGGIDRNPRIQILVYDIENDFSETVSTGHGVAGFFYSKDEYEQDNLDDSIKSNKAEMFYIDAYFTDSLPDTIYSTLIHEFQHMINYNQKFKKNGKLSEIWYDEMLAMLAEDVIAPKIGIGPTDPGHPITERIPGFLSNYWRAGVDQWDHSLNSYSNTYAFGAYLIRNYGGPRLIERMMSNNSVNWESVAEALQYVNNNSNLSFESALENYAEAFLYSTTHGGGIDGKNSFDRSPFPYTIGGSPYLYEAAGFNIWDATRFPRPGNPPGPYLYSDLNAGISYSYTMASHSVLLIKIPSNVYGDLYLNLTRPEDVEIKTVVLEY